MFVFKFLGNDCIYVVVYLTRNKVRKEKTISRIEKTQMVELERKLKAKKMRKLQVTRASQTVCEAV